MAHNNETDNLRILKGAKTPVMIRPTRHTVEEFDSLPEDRRVEMIDGVFYDMASPTVIHQDLVLDLATRIKSFIEKTKGNVESSSPPSMSA